VWLQRLLRKKAEMVALHNNFNRLVRELHGYERKFEELREQIRELLTLKINYWRELSHGSCKVTTIRGLAESFLAKFNDMNQFYLQKLKQTELEAGLLMGGVLYNLFLLVATNYKSLSDDNIKELRKQHESISGQLGVRRAYYCLTASLIDDKLGLIENHSRNLSELLSDKGDKPLMLVGQQVSDLIPEPYIPLHNSSMLKLNKRRNFHLMGGPFNNLFVLSTSKKLLPCQMQVDFCADMTNQLSVVALFKKEHTEYEHMLLDSDGKHLYSSASIDLHRSLLEQEAFRQAI